MKSRCPNCQTVFRVTPEQLKARAGKVRCGQCQAIFNALDHLLEEQPVAAQSVTAGVALVAQQSAPDTSALATEKPVVHEPAGFAAPLSPDPSTSIDTPVESPLEPSLHHAEPDTGSDEPGDGFFISPHHEETATPLKFEPVFAGTPAASENGNTPASADNADAPEQAEETGTPRLSESAAQELGKATGLIMPRETTEIPGYSKWAEGVMAAPVALPADKPTRWPFVVVTLALALGLAGQVAFHFRSEIATAMPSLRPMLASASQALGSDLPLPRHVELISIEVSDLQNDPAHGNLLVLNATLRNRAAYAQAYPSLELSLTDTQDTAIARRVFTPAEYLSPKTTASQPFGANSDLSVRLWIEARDITAAGYRLYVFYP